MDENTYLGNESKKQNMAKMQKDSSKQDKMESVGEEHGFPIAIGRKNGQTDRRDTDRGRHRETAIDRHAERWIYLSHLPLSQR